MEAGRGMKTGPSEVWEKLIGDEIPASGIVARPVRETLGRRLSAGVDSTGRRHLLVQLRVDENGLSDQKLRGIRVATRDLKLTDQAEAKYLDVLCHEPTGHAAFDIIAQELAGQLQDDKAPAAVVVDRTLSKWKRFWGALPRNTLTREEQIGLFGELWFLKNWLFPNKGEEVSLSAWRGPRGSRHDFELCGESIEVKSTISTRGAIHIIHGLDQLSLPEVGPLRFFSLMVREEGGATNSLPVLVRLIRESLNHDATLQVEFECHLAHAGYSDTCRDEYDRLKLRVVTENLYRVEESFPRLTKKSFIGEVPAGIETVQYMINLSGFNHLILARKPSEWL